jgi:ankyrin repeat protein
MGVTRVEVASEDRPPWNDRLHFGEGNPMRTTCGKVLVVVFLVLATGCSNDKPAVPVTTNEREPFADRDQPAPKERKDQPARDVKVVRPKGTYEERAARLFKAAEQGQVSAVLAVLTDGANVNDKDTEGQTALMKAAEKGHSGLVTELIIRNADVNEKDKKGQTALMRAAENGNVSIMKVLLVGALAKNQVGKGIEAGKALLEGAGAKLPDVKVPLLNDQPLGANEVDLRDSFGQTALMKAALGGQPQVIDLLLHAGANRDQKDAQGRTALMHAIQKGHADAAQKLLNNRAFGPTLGENTVADREGNTVLMQAVDRGDAVLVQTLLRTQVLHSTQPYQREGKVLVPVQNRESQTALMKAATKGQMDVVKLLVDSFGTDNKARLAHVCLKDKSGKTAAQLAEENKHAEVAAFLKAFGTLVARDDQGRTSLMRAVRDGDLEQVQTLLAKGADPAVRDNQGQPALAHAAAKGRTEIVELLLAASGENRPQRLISLTAKDKEGKTAAQLAEAGGHIALAALLKEYADPDLKDDKGQTALMRAADKGDRKVVQRLLDCGADPSLKDGQGQTALMHAAAKGHAGLVALAPLLNTKQLRDNQGWTALMHAASQGHFDAVKTLMWSFDSDFLRNNYLFLVDKTGKTAKDLATAKGYKDVVQRLENVTTR